MITKPTSIKIGSEQDPKSLKSLLIKRAKKKKLTLHCLIVNTLKESV